MEHVRFPLDNEWQYYGSSNEYILYDVDVVADELHEYIYNDAVPGTAGTAGTDSGSTDSMDSSTSTGKPSDSSTTGSTTSQPSATVDPESLVEEGGSYDPSTGDYYDSDGDRYYLDESGNRVYY